jgi:hypothetical protein
MTMLTLDDLKARDKVIWSSGFSSSVPKQALIAKATKYYLVLEGDTKSTRYLRRTGTPSKDFYSAYSPRIEPFTEERWSHFQAREEEKKLLNRRIRLCNNIKDQLEAIRRFPPELEVLQAIAKLLGIEE